MSTIVNKTIVHKFTIVNFKLLTFLFTFSIVLHMVATAISPEHPFLGGLLTLLEMAGWLWIVLIWNIAFIKGIWKWMPIIWTRMWTYIRTHIHLKKAQKEVTVAHLKSLLSNIDRLGLALHGLTPEMEKGRRTHLAMLGEAVPSLVVPAANAALYAEFTRLTQFLNGFGFPAVESVRLHPMDCEFAQNWGRDLEQRLFQSQKDMQQQQRAATQLLSLAIQSFLFIGNTYPAATQDAGYQRIHGALKLLEAMVQKNHCATELVTVYIPNLQRDMHTLLGELKNAAI